MTTASRPAIRVRGRSFIALALAPETPLIHWLQELDGQVARAPGYFAGKPVVLDLGAAPLHGPGLRGLLGELRQRGIHVIGLENIEAAALGEQLEHFPPILTGGRPGGAVEPLPEEGAPEESRALTPVLQAPSAAPEPAALLLRDSVRSGQAIHFARGDVTVIGSVASGAEIVAGGSIHVYGALRGRAMAGVAGDAEARIFCGKLDAEMLAVNGAYVTADDIGAELRGKRIQAWFDGAGISLATLD